MLGTISLLNQLATQATNRTRRALNYLEEK